MTIDQQTELSNQRILRELLHPDTFNTRWEQELPLVPKYLERLIFTNEKPTNPQPKGPNENQSDFPRVPTG